MTDDAAFRAAICGCPEDDTRRLVYADWLDENGDPERAAYIRHHVRGDPLPAGVLDGSPDLEWVPPLPRHTRREGADRIEYLDGDGLAITLVFRRGFVSRVALPVAAFGGQGCERCGGSGEGRTLVMTNPHVFGRCPPCSGTGRTSPLRGCLAGEPVEQVSISGKEPSEAFGSYRAQYAGARVWYGPSFAGHPEQGDVLPDPLFAEVVRVACDSEGCEVLEDRVRIPSRDAALNLLSRAAARFLTGAT